MRTAFYAMSVLAVLFGGMSSAPAQNNEPLMKGSSSVTPADEAPMPAVDRLSEDVSPAAHANTTATDQAGDAGTIPLPPEPKAQPADEEKDR